jgi:hypothetical protein
MSRLHTSHSSVSSTALVQPSYLTKSRAITASRRLMEIPVEAPCACGGGCPRCKAASGSSRAAMATSDSDPFEREADRAADQVIGMTQSDMSIVQREHRASGRKNPPSKSVAPAITPLAQTKHRANDVLGDSAPPQASITPRSGMRLPDTIRHSMEGGFDADFSNVRVHTDSNSALLASELHARAFAIGQDLYFGSNNYSPETSDGKRLLAHELTHVLQQRSNQALQTKRSPQSLDTNFNTASDATFKAIDESELAMDDLMARCRNWLTHNMILFTSDLLKSKKGRRIFDATNSATVDVGKEAIVNFLALGPTKLGEEYLVKPMQMLLTSVKVGKLLGGAFTFIIGSILEYAIGEIFDETSAIVEKTAEQMDSVVTGIVNPVANKKQKLIRIATQQMRAGLRSLNSTDAEWAQRTESILTTKKAAECAVPDETEASLYRQLSLKNEIYGGAEVPAEKNPPLVISSKTNGKFPVVIRKKYVESGYTKINVSKDDSTLVILMRTYDCLKGLDRFDFENEVKDYPQYADLDRSFSITLCGEPIDSFEARFSMNKVPRTFHVAKHEYGIWYNLKKGTYTLFISRPDSSSPLGLCGLGNYWVEER